MQYVLDESAGRAVNPVLEKKVKGEKHEKRRHGRGPSGNIGDRLRVHGLQGVKERGAWNGPPRHAGGV